MVKVFLCGKLVSLEEVKRNFAEYSTIANSKANVKIIEILAVIDKPLSVFGLAKKLPKYHPMYIRERLKKLVKHGLILELTITKHYGLALPRLYYLLTEKGFKFSKTREDHRGELKRGDVHEVYCGLFQKSQG